MCVSQSCSNVLCDEVSLPFILEVVSFITENIVCVFYLNCSSILKLDIPIRWLHFKTKFLYFGVFESIWIFFTHQLFDEMLNWIFLCFAVTLLKHVSQYTTMENLKLMMVSLHIKEGIHMILFAIPRWCSQSCRTHLESAYTDKGFGTNFLMKTSHSWKWCVMLGSKSVTTKSMSESP